MTLRLLAVLAVVALARSQEASEIQARAIDGSQNAAQNSDSKFKVYVGTIDGVRREVFNEVDGGQEQVAPGDVGAIPDPFGAYDDNLIISTENEKNLFVPKPYRPGGNKKEEKKPTTTTTQRPTLPPTTIRTVPPVQPTQPPPRQTLAPVQTFQPVQPLQPIQPFAPQPQPAFGRQPPAPVQRPFVQPTAAPTFAPRTLPPTFAPRTFPPQTRPPPPPQPQFTQAPFRQPQFTQAPFRPQQPQFPPQQFTQAPFRPQQFTQPPRQFRPEPRPEVLQPRFPERQPFQPITRPVPFQPATTPAPRLPFAGTQNLRSGVCAASIFYISTPISGPTRLTFSHFAIAVTVDQCARTCHEFNCAIAHYNPVNGHCEFNPSTAFAIRNGQCPAWPSLHYRNNVVASEPVRIFCVQCQRPRRRPNRQRTNAVGFRQRAFDPTQRQRGRGIFRSRATGKRSFEHPVIHGVLVKQPQAIALGTSQAQFLQAINLNQSAVNVSPVEIEENTDELGSHELRSKSRAEGVSNVNAADQDQLTVLRELESLQ